MSRILIVGGYGGFGGRLSRRLARAGHQVLVGGRDLGRAEAFCRDVARCEPIAVDRGDAGTVVGTQEAHLVIDAAGPFQGSAQALPKACIAARIPYLDLADARDFVCAINGLDAAAKQAGVAVVSGASSVPALSHAVVADLAQGMEIVTAIEMAISASSRAAAGDSVAAAILGGVGQPVRRWQGKRRTRDFGWQSIRRERFTLPSGKRLPTRLVALADIPDLALLPERVAGVSAVAFRAGTESALANLVLWAASWPVRWRWLRSLAGARAALLPLQRLTRLWGSDRSGMVVRVFGTAQGKRVERRWTLIAEQGDGPEIPTLAAAILAGRIATLEPGARDAGGLLSLADFGPALAELAVESATIEIDQPEPLYRRVMGDAFAQLSPAVRAVHSVLRDAGAEGEGTVTRGRSWPARLIAAAMRFPPEGRYELHVHFEECDGAERWTRDFGGHWFHSRLSQGEGTKIVEAFGPMRFHFTLPVSDGGLAMILKRWSLGPVPLPLGLAPRIAAREWEEAGRFHFDVAVGLPLIGPVVHYRGWLKP